jgi:hypothetical protein
MVVHVRNSFKPYLFGKLQVFDGGIVLSLPMPPE